MNIDNHRVTSAIMARLEPLVWKTMKKITGRRPMTTPEGIAIGTVDGIKWTYDFTTDSLENKKC